MNRVLSRAVVVAGLVVTLGGTVSWGQVPATNDKSDALKNTGGGTAALGSPMLSGTFNTAYGYAALEGNTGDNNTATGYYALADNTTGTNNTASGYWALVMNSTGGNNTAA